MEWSFFFGTNHPESPLSLFRASLLFFSMPTPETWQNGYPDQVKSGIKINLLFRALLPPCPSIVFQACKTLNLSKVFALIFPLGQQQPHDRDLVFPS